jgi:uncharacterized protein (DUF4415 family)
MLNPCSSMPPRSPRKTPLPQVNNDSSPWGRIRWAVFSWPATRKERKHYEEGIWLCEGEAWGSRFPEGQDTDQRIYIDNDVLEQFRQRADASGRGYQTMMNEALREYLGKSPRPVDETTLPRILREELKIVG